MIGRNLPQNFSGLSLHQRRELHQSRMEKRGGDQERLKMAKSPKNNERGFIFNSTLRRNKKIVKIKGAMSASSSLQAKPKTWKKTGLKKVGKSQRARLAKYYPLQREFLSRPENRLCVICLCRSLDSHLDLIIPILKLDPVVGDGVFERSGATMRRSEEVHHRFGRGRSNLCDERGFIASCRGCRIPVHEDIKKSRELGLIGSATQWNTPIDRH